MNKNPTLRDFCSDELGRGNIALPFPVGDYICATDGKFAVLVEKKASKYRGKLGDQKKIAHFFKSCLADDYEKTEQVDILSIKPELNVHWDETKYDIEIEICKLGKGFYKGTYLEAAKRFAKKMGCDGSAVLKQDEDMQAPALLEISPVVFVLMQFVGRREDGEKASHSSTESLSKVERKVLGVK